MRVTVAADWGGSMGGCGCAGGRALLWGSCWRRAMSALALLRCAWAASSLHHSATRRPPFPCCRFSRLSVANSVGGAAVPRVCEGGSAGLRRQACTLPGYGDEGIRSPTLRGAQLTPTAPTAAGPSRHDPRPLPGPGFPTRIPSKPSDQSRTRLQKMNQRFAAAETDAVNTVLRPHDGASSWGTEQPGTSLWS